MANVLLVKANDRPVDQAVTVQLHEAFVKAYKESHPEDVVTELDLFNVELPYYGNEAITALYKASNGVELTAGEAALSDLINGYLEQFLATDKVVFSFPLWNYTVPAPLVTYISYLAQAGKTFKYTPEGAVGLAGDKKAILLSARGGVYSAPPMDAFESASRFIKGAIGLWGLNPSEIVIEGHNQNPADAKAIIEAGLAEAAAAAAYF